MALKALEIKTFKPLDKPYRKADAKGLYLEVRPNGSKLWFYKFRVDGKEKRLGLGAWPDMGLADARAAHEAARKEVLAGGDPLLDRKLGKIQRRVDAGNSFQSVAEDFIETKLVANGKAEATIEKARWFLSHLTPALGARAIADIQPAEVLEALKKIEKCGHRETAVRTIIFNNLDEN